MFIQKELIRAFWVNVLAHEVVIETVASGKTVYADPKTRDPRDPSVFWVSHENPRGQNWERVPFFLHYRERELPIRETEKGKTLFPTRSENHAMLVWFYFRDHLKIQPCPDPQSSFTTSVTWNGRVHWARHDLVLTFGYQLFDTRTRTAVQGQKLGVKYTCKELDVHQVLNLDQEQIIPQIRWSPSIYADADLIQKENRIVWKSRDWKPPLELDEIEKT